MTRIHNISKKIKESCDDILIRICEELHSIIHKILINKIKEGYLDILIRIYNELHTRIHKISIKIREGADILIEICEELHTRIHKILIKIREGVGILVGICKKLFARIHKILIGIRKICNVHNLISICKKLLYNIPIVYDILMDTCEELFVRIHNFLIMIRQSCVYITHIYCQLWFCVQMFLFFRIKRCSYYTSYELFYSLFVYTMVDIEMRFFDDLILEALYVLKVVINRVFFPYEEAVEHIHPKFFGPPLMEVCHTDPELKDF